MPVSRSNGSQADHAPRSNDDGRVVSLSYRRKAVLNGMQGSATRNTLARQLVSDRWRGGKTDDIVTVTEFSRREDGSKRFDEEVQT